MADSQVSMEWSGEGLRFEAAHASHNTFRVDGDGATSHSPVQALLLSVASCMGADVVDIVTKMRVPMSGLSIAVEGDRNAEPPRYFKAIRMRFTVRGVTEADREKVQRALDLSHEKYCSVFHSLRKDLEFSYDLVLS